MSKPGDEIDRLRDRLTEIDGRILELAAERQGIVGEIGELKRGAGQGTRDFAREKEVLEGALAKARACGLSPEFAEQVVRMLIRSSLTEQEQARVAAEGRGGGRRALIIGGAGRMGAWFADFLDSQGYAVGIADPQPGGSPYPAVRDWRELVLDHDLIVVAAPLTASAKILEALAERRPRGLVFDLGSLKGPLAPGLEAMARAGCRVTSLHPMFGPDTRLLSGRHVIFVDVGCPEATREARTLFDATMAEQVEMDLAAHDRLIAYVLGLSHALNIAFFTALAESGEAVPHLSGISSTTFDAQLAVSGGVAGENPSLYFEIQSLNRHGPEVLNALAAAVDRVRAAVLEADEESFVALMERGRAYLESRRQARAG